MFERIATGLVCGMSLLACASVAQAQTSFPNRPITMVVPLPAGGTADLLCRLAAEKASSLLGQQVVIENRAGGAGGRVAIEAVLRSPPDGYTVLCAPQLTYTIAHLLFTKSAFDTRAMEPVSVLATYPLDRDRKGGSCRPTTCPSFLAYAQANPGKVNYGHQGKGNTGHLLGELLMLKGKFRMTEIPYRGSAPAINDLLGGNIDIVPDYLLANKQNIDAGKLKILATGGRERHQELSQGRDHRGDAAGRLCRYLDGGGGAARHAEGDRASESRTRSGRAFKTDGSAQAHPGAGGRAARQLAGADARHDQGEHGALGAGDRGGQDRHRIITSE